MATLPTLRPGAANTVGLPTAGSIIGNPGGATALSDDSSATFDSQNTNASGTYQYGRELGDTPADLGTMSALSIQFSRGWQPAPSNSTWDSLSARIMASDGTTVLAAGSAGGTFQTVDSNITSVGAVLGSVVPFSYVNTGATKAQWDGAVVQVQWDRTRTKGGDASEARIYEAFVTGTYNVASVDRRARITWAETEVPDFARRAQVTWAELETPSPPASVSDLFDVTDWAFYEDGPEASSALLTAAKNQGAVGPTDTPIVLRFLVENNTGIDRIVKPQLKMRYIDQGDGSAQDWTPARGAVPNVVPMNDVTGISSHVNSRASGTISDGAATTQRLGAGGFVAGLVDTGDGTFPTGVTVPAGSTTEICFVVEMDSTDMGAGPGGKPQYENFQFKIVDADSGNDYASYVGGLDSQGNQFASLNPPMTFDFDFEVGTNGVAVATTDLSPDSFDAIIGLAGGGRPTYSNVNPLWGTLVGRINYTSGEAVARFRWHDINQGGEEQFLRFYIRYNGSLPASTHRFAEGDGGYEAGDITSFALTTRAAGTLELRDGAGTNVATSAQMVADAWYRIELHRVRESIDGAADGYLELRLYEENATSPMAGGTVSISSATTQTEWEDFEIATISAGVSVDYSFDEIAIRNSGTWIGPATGNVDRRVKVTWAELETPSVPRAARVAWSELEIPNAARSAQVTWAEVEVPNAARSAQVTWAEVEVPTAPRSAQITWAELEVPFGAAAAQITWAEFEVPNGARSALVVWAEAEIPTAPRRARITWSEVELPTAPRAGVVTFAELEVPNAPRSASVTWAEFEVPNGARTAIVTWAEVELPTAPRRSIVTWAELQLPDAPSLDKRAIVTFAELEIPTAPRSAYVTWAEMELPDAPRRALVAWSELEVPNGPRAARVAWAEMETPNAGRSAFVTWAELETPNAGRNALVTFAELEVPNGARRVLVSWSELEIPNPDRAGVVTWAELEVPNGPNPDRSVLVSWSELELPNGARRTNITWAELEVPNADRRGLVAWAELELPNAGRNARISWTELELPNAPRAGLVTWAELEVPNGARNARISWSELEIPTAARRSLITFAELETPAPPRSAIVTWAEFQAPTLGRIDSVTLSKIAKLVAVASSEPTLSLVLTTSEI